MISVVTTLFFYSIAVFLVCRRCHAEFRMLAIGSLPVAWISICGLAGVLYTLSGVPAWATLAPVFLALAVTAVKLTPIGQTNPIVADPKSKPFLALCADAAPWTSVVACALYAAFQAQYLEPRGSWDTLFTWVLRGRFFFVGGAQWHNAFSNDLALLHPDYPPLFGWALSCLWQMDGQESSVAIASLFYPIWPAFVLLILGWKSVCTGSRRLDLTLAAVIAMPILWKEASSKFSDFALAYSILGSCAWYQAARVRQNQRAMFVAGFLAVWGGLIKNEGIPWAAFFLIGTTIDLLIDRTTQFRRCYLTVLAGAAIPVIAIAAFKITLSPPNDLASPKRSFEIGEIVQPGIMVDPSPLKERLWHAELPIIHELIWRKLLSTFIEGHDWGIALWWWAALFFCRLRHLKQAAPLLMAVVLQGTLYYFIYVISPYHIYWHLSTSLSRIMTHVVPAGICLTAFTATLSVPPSTKSKPPRVTRQSAASTVGNRLPSFIRVSYLVLMPIWIASSIMWKDWQLGKQPAIDLKELAAIEFPRVDKASYVTSNVGTTSFYSTQYQSVPTVLVVDRREPILLARFHTEEELRQYCAINQWQLVQNIKGLGWARDAGGTGLPQPVKLTPIR